MAQDPKNWITRTHPAFDLWTLDEACQRASYIATRRALAPYLRPHRFEVGTTAGRISTSLWSIFAQHVGEIQSGDCACMNHSRAVKNSDLLPRALTARVQQALQAFPVVVVTGARQTGKSTLVRQLLQEEHRLYVTLDDIDVRDQAERAPDDLVRRAPRMTLDEVQRSPDLMLAVKRAVDEVREPGRFILTGSANLLLMERVSESLAGRAAYLALRPLTRREQLGWRRPGDGTLSSTSPSPPGTI